MLNLRLVNYIMFYIMIHCINFVENNIKIATEMKGLELVCNALRTHMNSAEVAEAASAAMLAFSREGRSYFCLFLHFPGLNIKAFHVARD